MSGKKNMYKKDSGEKPSIVDRSKEESKSKEPVNSRNQRNKSTGKRSKEKTVAQSEQAIEKQSQSITNFNPIASVANESNKQSTVTKTNKKASPEKISTKKNSPERAYRPKNSPVKSFIQENSSVTKSDQKDSNELKINEKSLPVKYSTHDSHNEDSSDSRSEEENLQKGSRKISKKWFIPESKSYQPWAKERNLVIPMYTVPGVTKTSCLGLCMEQTAI